MSWFIKTITQNYANFSGRAQRAEYWYFMLFANIAIALAVVIDGLLAASGVFPLCQLIFTFGLILPALGVQVRRLHDIGKSGALWFLNFIPCVGGLILIIWAVQDSDPGDNQYGPNPKGIGGPAPQTDKAEAGDEGETGKAEAGDEGETGKAEAEE